MEEIRFTESDENYLFLETLSGDKFKLSIDDGLRSAVRHQGGSKPSDDAISPREIQDRIRSGSTVAELASETGASESLLAKFAAPVLDEMAHIVNSAKSVRLTVATDRPNVTEHVEFGQVIESRLRSSGALNLVWSAKKIEGQTWRISVSFSLGDQAQQASWLFDLRKLSLAPENDMAIRLSTEELVSANSSPTLTAVEPVAQNYGAGEATKSPDVHKEEPDDVHSLADQAEVEDAMTIDLLDALRKKRESRKEMPTPVRTEAHVNQPEELLVERPIQSEQSPAPEEPVAELPTDAIAKKGRASMPSWDQIVFGTKSED